MTFESMTCCMSSRTSLGNLSFGAEMPSMRPGTISLSGRVASLRQLLRVACQANQINGRYVFLLRSNTRGARDGQAAEVWHGHRLSAARRVVSLLAHTLVGPSGAIVSTCLRDWQRRAEWVLCRPPVNELVDPHCTPTVTAGSAAAVRGIDRQHGQSGDRVYRQDGCGSISDVAVRLVVGRGTGCVFAGD